MKSTAIILASFLLLGAIQVCWLFIFCVVFMLLFQLSVEAAPADDSTGEIGTRLLKLKLAKKVALALGLGAAKLAFLPMILSFVGGGEEVIYYYYYVDEFGNPI